MADNCDSGTTAIFIDGDWLYHAGRRLNEKIDYAQLKATLDDCFSSEAPIHFFRSIDAQKQEQQEFVKTLKSMGYIVHVSKLHRRKDRSGKISFVRKCLDVALAVSAMALPDKFKTIVLLSGDSAFLSLVETGRHQGREVILITLPLVSRALVQASGEKYINLETLLKKLETGQRNSRNQIQESRSPREYVCGKRR